MHEPIEQTNVMPAIMPGMTMNEPAAALDEDESPERVVALDQDEQPERVVALNQDEQPERAVAATDDPMLDTGSANASDRSAVIEEPGTPMPHDENAPAAEPGELEGDNTGAESVNAVEGQGNKPMVGGHPVHPVADMFGWMPQLDFADLVTDIRQNGLIQAIIMHDDQVVDGRHRLRACVEAGIAPRFIQWRDHYTGPMTLVRWMWAVNARRRHLTPEQMAAAHLAVRGWEDREEARRKQAEGRQRGGESGGRGRAKPDSLLAKSPASYAEAPVPTSSPDAAPAEKTAHSTGRRSHLSREFGVTDHTAKQLLEVERTAPELLPKIARGDTPLRNAAKQVKAKQARERGDRAKPKAKRKPAKPSGSMADAVNEIMARVNAILKKANEADRKWFLKELKERVKAK